MKYLLIVSIAVFTCHCLNTSQAFAQQGKVAPASDPSNTGGWTLREDLSDEFEGSNLDESKWFIQGTGGEYRSNFIGRAPSQFSTENVRVEDGKLKLETRWEPEFNFSKKIDRTDKAAADGRPYENITTAAVISKNQLLYGYMEIKCKAANASITSSFWMTGNKSELDIFEFLARPAQTHKTHLERELWSSIHDWSKPGGPTTWTDKLQLDWKVADDFHLYGVEWDEDYLKFHADGKLVRSVSRTEVGDEGWVITGPLWIWVDSETFPWHGIPVAADLPVDYEIEYIRVWQKNLIDSIFFSFEAPVATNAEKKDWWIAEDSRPYFAVVNEKSASGLQSLKFAHTAPLANNATVFAPFGSLKIDAGSYVFSMKVWLEPGSSVHRLRVILQDPWLELKPFDLTGVAAGKWVTLSQEFSRNAASGIEDRPRIVVQPDDVTGTSSTMYIDDLAIEEK